MNAVPLVRNIGLKVQERRRAAEITQRQLAEAADVSERLIRSLEAGEARGIGLEKLMAVLAPLGLGLCLVDEGGEVELSDGAADTSEDDYEALLLRAVSGWTGGGDGRG